MICAEFDSWLDRGRLKSEGTTALAHASTCARCARVLAAADAVERLLAEPVLPAPEGFSERVMLRVSAARRPSAVHTFEPAVEWWVRVAAEPAAALALILAALLAWRGDVLLRLDPLVTKWAAGASLQLTAASPAGFDHAARTPMIALALALAALPIVLWASWRAFVWAERACVPTHPAMSAA